MHTCPSQAARRGAAKGTRLLPVSRSWRTCVCGGTCARAQCLMTWWDGTCVSYQAGVPQRVRGDAGRLHPRAARQLLRGHVQKGVGTTGSLVRQTYCGSAPGFRCRGVGNGTGYRSGGPLPSSPTNTHIRAWRAFKSPFAGPCCIRPADWWACATGMGSPTPPFWCRVALLT